jgi:hypothetical protein
MMKKRSVSSDYPVGWKNYPTWAVYVWITNDSRFETVVRAAHHRTIRPFRELVEGIAAEGLVTEPSLASDLLGWALDEVDWEFLKDEIVRLAERMARKN